jgi:hypothetical protein
LKPILIAVVGCLLAVAAVVFVVCQPRNSNATTAGMADSSGPSAAPAASSGAADAEALARLDALDREVSDLRAQLAALKSGADRQVSAAPAAVETESHSNDMTAAEHESVLKVIAEDRAEQKRKQDEDRQQRELQNALAHADRAAQKYGLSLDQKKGLVDVFVLDAQKSNDLQTFMQQQGFNGDREAIRKAFTDLDDWRTSELTKRFGADLAQQIHDGEFNRGPRGGQRGNRNGGGPGQGG